MAGYILRGEEKSVVLSAAQTDLLLKSGNGDAALLYLALQRTDRAVTEGELQEKLSMSALRLNAAESALAELGLIASPAERTLPVSEERLNYTREDVAQMLEGDSGFRTLIPQVEEKLGKKLKTTDLQMMAALYDDAGLPADVIYLLTCHCIERCERQYGQGRRPTVRQIEKEGFYWAQRGIMDQDSAAKYLKDYAEKTRAMGDYLKVLQIAGRSAVAGEMKYIRDWMDKGFPPETVAMAYEKTVMYRGEMNWRYLNGILRRWDEAGLHTPEEVEQGDRKSGEKSAAGKNSWVKKYIRG